MWTAWLYSQEWWRRELWRVGAPADITLGKVIETYRTKFIPDADANDLILQMRAWQRHDISGNSRYNGQIEAALRSIRTPILYMPSLTDLYFPIEDARYEARLIPGVTFKPIPSLWATRPARARQWRMTSSSTRRCLRFWRTNRKSWCFRACACRG